MFPIQGETCFGMIEFCCRFEGCLFVAPAAIGDTAGFKLFCMDIFMTGGTGGVNACKFLNRPARSFFAEMAIAA